MAYKITNGITESELSTWLDKARNRLGTFPDGRIDYTNADTAPIVMCTLVCDGRIFIAKRGFGLADAEGCWSTVNGFIDENKSVAEIAAQEFLEETGIFIKPSQIKVGKAYTLKSTNNKRSYIVFPCLAVVARMPKIQLDREHTDFQWIKRSELENFHILDDLPVAVDAALKLL